MADSDDPRFLIPWGTEKGEEWREWKEQNEQNEQNEQHAARRPVVDRPASSGKITERK
jgi:hypothetical protein